MGDVAPLHLVPENMANDGVLSGKLSLFYRKGCVASRQEIIPR